MSLIFEEKDILNLFSQNSEQDIMFPISFCVVDLSRMMHMLNLNSLDPSHHWQSTYLFTCLLSHAVFENHFVFLVHTVKQTQMPHLAEALPKISSQVTH